MPKQDLSAIVNFLEKNFTFTVEKLKPVKENLDDYYLAKHPVLGTFGFYSVADNLCVFKAKVIVDKPWSDDFWPYFNDVNQKFSISKAYFTAENNQVMLNFEAIFSGDYSEGAFEQFYGAFSNDVANIWRQGKGFEKFLL